MTLNPRQFDEEDVLGAFGGAKPARSMEDHELLTHLQQHHGLHQKIQNVAHMDQIRMKARNELPRHMRGPKDFMKSRTSRMVLEETHDGDHALSPRFLDMRARDGFSKHGHAR